MFSTYAADEMHLLSALAEQDESYWTCVKQHLHAPWFYVVCSQDYGADGEFMHMLLLSHGMQLQQLSQDSAIEVVEVNVVLPAHMTPQKRWIMEPLASLWEGHMPGEKVLFQVYVTADGRRYVSDDALAHENELVDKKLIYQSPLSHAG